MAKIDKIEKMYAKTKKKYPNITNARQNLFQLVSDVNKGFNPINIINTLNTPTNL